LTPLLGFGVSRSNGPCFGGGFLLEHLNGRAKVMHQLKSTASPG